MRSASLKSVIIPLRMNFVNFGTNFNINKTFDPAPAVESHPRTVHLHVGELAIAVLTAEIASAHGDHTAAAAKLRDAVQMQDALIYDEPPIW